MPLLRTASLALACLGMATGTSLAEEWPASKPVKIVVPFAPGSSSDQFYKLSLLTQDLNPAGVTKFVADEYA